ncbi:MAG: MazG nucleotide pyrophosphohydrolase domain-containing protein [Bacilli bacterium]
MLISNTIILMDLEKTKIDNDKKQLVACLREESSELVYALLHNDAENIKEELADVYIVLAQIAQMYEFTEFDLVDKLEDVKRRYKKESE